MSKFTVLAFLVGAILGAVLVFLLLQRHADSVTGTWYVLDMDNRGPGFSTEAFTADIQLPTTSNISGKAKFLDSNQAGAHHITLGYIVNVTVDRLKTASIPAKYRQTRKLGVLTLLPITVVAYSAGLTFDLEDADGFVLERLTSGPIDLRSGQENVLQGIAKEPVPFDVAQRTKTIKTDFIVDKCLTCQ